MHYDMFWASEEVCCSGTLLPPEVHRVESVKGVFQGTLVVMRRMTLVAVVAWGPAVTGVIAAVEGKTLAVTTPDRTSLFKQDNMLHSQVQLQEADGTTIEVDDAKKYQA